MKKIRFEWVNTDDKSDDFLSIISEEAMCEVAQLRKSPKSSAIWGDYYRNQDRTWCIHPTGMTDVTLDELFGQNWYYETYGGFETVEKFKAWARGKKCL
mgnify:CR=1 FL=1|jgi:hypothetical protein